uniref:helix-turn-helix transcriptional regulator n=1 Tax=Candidatus Fimenecus sp. TaxID=3022888 RepID=UPI003FEE716E
MKNHSIHNEQYKGVKIIFSKQLKCLRNKKHLSQAQLAKKIGVSSSTVAMWEIGEREPKNYKTLEIIADFFNVSLDYLIDRDVPQSRMATADLITEQEKALLAFYRTASEENKLKIIQFIMNNTNGSS